MATYGGWTGKILRVDLTRGKIEAEDTLPKYKDWMGGSGLAYKIIWDEVPVGTQAYDPENIIVLGGGPLTGTGAPTGGRCTITSLFPSTPGHLVARGHMGGSWAPELKFAGWDAVVVTGRSEKPVWLCIEDDKVTATTVRNRLRNAKAEKADAEELAALNCLTKLYATETAAKKALKDANVIVTIEKDLSMGYESALLTDLKGAFYNSPARMPIIGFAAGLGGRDIGVKQIRGIVERASKVKDAGIEAEFEIFDVKPECL